MSYLPSFFLDQRVQVKRWYADRNVRNAAASAGLLLYGVGLAVSRGWLSPTDVGGLLVILLIALVATRSGGAAAIVMLPCLVIRLALARPDWQLLVFVLAVATHIWLVQVAPARRWLASRSARPALGETRG